MKPPEHVNATQEQLDELLTLAKPVFPAAQYELLQGVLATFVFVMLALQNAKTSLARFRKMLFGGKTESKRNVLGQGAATGDKPAEVDEANAEAGAAPVVERVESGPSPCRGRCCSPRPDACPRTRRRGHHAHRPPRCR